MVPVVAAAVACVLLLSRHLPTTSSAPMPAWAPAAPPTGIGGGTTAPVGGGDSAGIAIGGGALGGPAAGGGGGGGGGGAGRAAGPAVGVVGGPWSLPSGRGGAGGEGPSEDDDVESGGDDDIVVRADDDEGLCTAASASDRLRPGWMEMDGGQGGCQDDAATTVAETEEGAGEGGSNDGGGGGGGRGDETIHDDGGGGAAARACADLEEGGGAIGGTVPAHADDGQDEDDAASVPVLTPSSSSTCSSSSSSSIHSSGARSVEFNQHLLVEVDVTVVDPWERVADHDIPSPPSAHLVGVTVKDDAGGSRSGTAGDYSARGATWSGDHSSSSSSSSNGSESGSGWAVTLEEVVFTHRRSRSRLDRMERRVWPTDGNFGSAGAASASTSFLLPLEALDRHVMEQSADSIDQIQDLVLRASLVELVRSAKDETIDRRVAMARLVPVPLTEDGRINPVIGVNLNGTASAQPVRIGDDLMTPSAPSSWSSMLMTAVAAVAVGVGMALCFLYMYPASVDEYEYYHQQQEEQEHINYTYVHHNDNEASTEVVEEMVTMELEGGVEGDMRIGNAADAAASQAGEIEREEGGGDGDGVASPPDLRRKMTATDIVGALSTPAKTPVKQQPATSDLGEMPSYGSPIQHGGAVDEPTPLPDDESVQQPQEEQPQEEQPLLDHGVNDTSGAVLLERNGIEEQGPGSGGQSSPSAEEQNRSSSGSWGLTLGQTSFCSDSSAASASSIETHLHANWKQSQSQAEKDPAPTADTARRSITSIAASSPTRSTSSSIAAEAGNMTTIGDATTERQDRQPRRRPRQLPSQNAPLFVEKRSPKHRKVEVKPLPTVGASRRLKKEEKKWDDSRYKFGATSGGGSLSSKDRSASTNKAPSVAKSDSLKSVSKRKRKTTMPLASISVPSDVNAKKQRKST